MVDQEIRVLGDENIIANPKNSQKQYPLTFKAVSNVIVYGRKKEDLNFTVPIAEGTNFNFNLERTAIIFSDSFNLEEYSYIMVKNPFEEISDFFYVSSLEELDPTGKEFNEFNDEVVKWLRRLVNIISNRCMIFETTLFKDLNNFPNIKSGQTFIRTEDGWTGITIRDINSELDLIFNKYVEEINKKIQEHQVKMNELLEQWKQDIQKYAENVKQYEIVRIVTQSGHGFVFEPVMYSISQRKFVKAVFPHGADGVAVRVDDNNFRLVWAGRVEIPVTAKDTQQRDFVLGEYYFLGEGSNGGIQREKPDTYYQHLFQVMYPDELQQNIADVLLSVPINQKGKRWDVGEAKTTVNDIEELKMSDFPVGKVVEVLGYYKAGDGADHKRIIADTDDGSGVQLRSGKWANIVHNGEVNVSWFGAKGDGVTDDTEAIQKAIYNSKSCLMDLGKVYIVTDTIRVGYGYKSLKSVTSGGLGLPEIKYNGAEDRKKAVVILGNNNVGEFKKEATNITLENIKINANNLCGIGLYGTYVKNESVVRQISVYNALEYGVYFAKSWYATYENITVSDSKGNGIALGMELRFSDGTIINPTGESENIIQMNGTFISKLRAINCGKGINTQDNKYGYGIGIGSGHCINVKDFVSEGCEIGVLVWRKFGSPFNVSNFYCEQNTKELLLDLRESSYSDTVVGKITNGYIENFEYLLGGNYETYKGIILENITLRTRKNFSGTDIFDLRNCNFNFNGSNPIVSNNITSENIIQTKYGVDLRYTSSLDLKIPLTKILSKRLHLISDKEYDITGATYKCFDINGNAISSYNFPNTLKKGSNFINIIPSNTYRITMGNVSKVATNVDFIITKL